MSVEQQDAERDAFAWASHFRDIFYACLTARGDVLFELTDALLCVDGPVTSPVDLTLTAEHRRGHGAMYDALNCGDVNAGRLRRLLAALPQPRAADGRLVLAVDVTHWLRPDAPCSADRLFCHVYGRNGRASDQLVPGWPYSFVAALESGRTSWCQFLDAVRLGPADDAAEVTASQLRHVVEDLIHQERWRPSDPDILIVCDAGYDAPRLAYLLDGLPVEVLGRLRADRVMRRPATRTTALPQGGRIPKHGPEFRLAKPETWGDPDTATVQATERYGLARTMGWDRVHPRLWHRSAWIDHNGELPVIEGTLIRLEVDHLPGDATPLPVWLWSSRTGLTGADTADDQADPRLDPPETAYTPGRGPLDLARHRRPHPAPAPPRSRLGPTPPLGEARRARPAHPRPSPPRVSQPPSAPGKPGPRAETLPPRPRKAARVQEQTACHQAQRRQDCETSRITHRACSVEDLKIKLSLPEQRASSTPPLSRTPGRPSPLSEPIPPSDSPLSRQASVHVVASVRGPYA
jgi:hypothetical protein